MSVIDASIDGGGGYFIVGKIIIYYLEVVKVVINTFNFRGMHPIPIGDVMCFRFGYQGPGSSKMGGLYKAYM